MFYTWIRLDVPLVISHCVSPHFCPRFWPSIPWKMEVVFQGAPGFSIISLQTSSRMVSPSHSRPHVPRTQTPWRTVSRCAGEPLRLASPWSRTSRQPLGREKSGLRGSGHGGWGPEECPLNSRTEWDAPGTSVARKHFVENSFEYFELPLVLLLRPRQGWRGRLFWSPGHFRGHRHAQEAWLCWVICVYFQQIHQTYPGWWFGTFFIFPNSWDDDPLWLIFFRRVETCWNHQLVSLILASYPGRVLVNIFFSRSFEQI